MPIRSYNSINAGFLSKYLTVGQLRNAIKHLDNNCRLYPNQVGNLTVANSKDEDVGYIDFVSGKFHWF